MMARRVTTLDEDMLSGFLCQVCGNDFEWHEIHHDSYDFTTDKGVTCYCVDCYADEIDPTCKECGGRGDVSRSHNPRGVWSKYLGAYLPDDDEMECPTCNGTGEVKR